MLEKGLISAIDENQARIFNLGNLYRFYMDRDDIADNLLKRWTENPGDAIEVSQNLVSLATEVYQEAVIDASDGSNEEEEVDEDENTIDVEAAIKSVQYKKYINAVAELEKIEILSLNLYQKVAFFLNIYQAMYVHHFLKKVHE